MGLRAVNRMQWSGIAVPTDSPVAVVTETVLVAGMRMDGRGAAYLHDGWTRSLNLQLLLGLRCMHYPQPTRTALAEAV